MYMVYLVQMWVILKGETQKVIIPKVVFRGTSEGLDPPSVMFQMYI